MAVELHQARFELKDEQASLDLAACFAAQRPPQQDREPCRVIFLHGDLGAGKTTFCRGFIQALGYEGKVKSPTYTLIEPYQIDSLSIAHLDLYRLTDAQELAYLGIEDLVEQCQYMLIEWPQRGAELLPEVSLNLQLEHVAPGRQLLVTAHQASAVAWLKRVATHFLG